VSLVLGVREDAVLVPESSLQYQGSQAMLYVVQAGEGGDVARVRRVRVGERRAGSVEIVEGVRAGERVVTQGLQRIRDGARVHAQAESAAAPSGAAAGGS
jgi:membrane fusion protein, multidrug efflux system